MALLKAPAPDALGASNRGGKRADFWPEFWATGYNYFGAALVFAITLVRPNQKFFYLRRAV
jgi:hypothetical protein